MNEVEKLRKRFYGTIAEWEAKSLPDRLNEAHIYREVLWTIANIASELYDDWSMVDYLAKGNF